MKIRLIAVGQRPPEWVSKGFTDYARRFPREMPLDLVEVAPAVRRSAKSVRTGAKSVRTSAEPARRNLPEDRVRELEAERLLGQVGDREWVVALDERGKSWTTLQMAEKLDDWRMQGRDVAFLIGGADGLDEVCRARADHVLALSVMTFPHALVRILLAEQLYRAWTVLSGHPYHRGC